MRVVLFLVRGLPAGWVGGYGNEWVGTPNIDRLTAEGVTFDRHYSEGARGEGHGAWGKQSDLPGLLRSAGVVVVDGDDFTLPHAPCPMPLAPSVLWFDFDDLLPPWNAPAGIFDAYLEDLLDDADPADDRPTPLTDIPTDYNPADDDARDLLHYSFAAAVTAFDAALGDLFEQLEAAGWGDAVWLLTSDYGQELDAGGPVSAATVHVPLVIRFPGGDHAGRRVPAFTQPADVVPTLLSLFGVTPPPGTAGFDLRPLCDGTATSVRDAVVSVADGDRAIRTADWSLIVPAEGEPRLYARPDDRWEATDLRARQVETAEELEQQLREILTGSAAQSTTGGE